MHYIGAGVYFSDTLKLLEGLTFTNGPCIVTAKILHRDNHQSSKVSYLQCSMGTSKDGTIGGCCRLAYRVDTRLIMLIAQISDTLELEYAPFECTVGDAFEGMSAGYFIFMAGKDR